tara:strand:+ start:1682 stop:1945 length:264 start_codon:yes stop_codon:yes gene_type:complete
MMDILLCGANPLILGMLTWVIFTLYKLQSKPPMLISCGCFNDVSHDDMVKVKEMYCELKKRAEETDSSENPDKEKEEDDGIEVKKED